MSQLIISNNYLSGIQEEMNTQLRSLSKYQERWRQMGSNGLIDSYFSEFDDWERIGQPSAFLVEHTDPLSVQIAGGYGAFMVFGAACVRVVSDTELVEALLFPTSVIYAPFKSISLGVMSVRYFHITAPDWELAA